MKRLGLLILFLAQAQAQFTPFTGLPNCANQCADSTFAGCDTPDDIGCICASTAFLSTVQCCLVTSCDAADAQTAISQLDKQCANEGPALPTSVSCPGKSFSSSTPSSPASTSSLSSSSSSSSQNIPSTSTSSTNTPSKPSTSASPPTSPTTPSATPGSGSGSASTSGSASSTTSPGGVVSPPAPTQSAAPSKGLSTGAKAGIGAGAGAVGLIVLLLAFFLLRRRRSTKTSPSDSEDALPRKTELPTESGKQEIQGRNLGHDPLYKSGEKHDMSPTSLSDGAIQELPSQKPNTALCSAELGLNLNTQEMGGTGVGLAGLGLLPNAHELSHHSSPHPVAEEEKHELSPDSPSAHQIPELSGPSSVTQRQELPTLASNHEFSTTTPSAEQSQAPRQTFSQPFQYINDAVELDAGSHDGASEAIHTQHGPGSSRASSQTLASEMSASANPARMEELREKREKIRLEKERLLKLQELDEMEAAVQCEMLEEQRRNE